MATMLQAQKPFYEIQSEMAESEQQQQSVEINKINIEAAKQKIADQQAAKQDMIKAYQMTQQQQPQQTPGQEAQPSITELAKTQTQPTLEGTQPTQVKGPDGTPMPSFMRGPTQEEAAKTSATPEGQKQQPKPDATKDEPKPILEQMKMAKKSLDTQDEAIAINNNAIKLAYQRGDAATAKDLLEMNNELKLKRADAELKSLNVTQKGLEIGGQVASGYSTAYNQFLKDNPNATPEEKQAKSDQLWAQFITSGQIHGATGEDLYKYVTPDQRNQYSEGLKEASEKASDRVKLKINEVNNATKLQIANQRDDIANKKFNLDNKYKSWQMNSGDVKNGISILEEKRKILDTELKTERQAALLGDEKAQAKINAAEAELKQVKQEITKVGQRPGGAKAISDAEASDSKTSFDSSKLPDAGYTYTPSVPDAIKQKFEASMKDPRSDNNKRQAIINQMISKGYLAKGTTDTKAAPPPPPPPPPAVEAPKPKSIDSQIADAESKIKALETKVERRADPKKAEASDIAAQAKSEKEAYGRLGTGIGKVAKATGKFITGEARAEQDKKDLEELKALLADLKKQKEGN